MSMGFEVIVIMFLLIQIKGSWQHFIVEPLSWESWQKIWLKILITTKEITWQFDKWWN